MNFDIEVKLLLAPEKAKQSYMTTLAASKTFMFMNGRAPSSGALQERFVAEAIEIDCTEADVQWLVDEGLLHADVLLGWKAAIREHT